MVEKQIMFLALIRLPFQIKVNAQNFELNEWAFHLTQLSQRCWRKYFHWCLSLILLEKESFLKDQYEDGLEFMNETAQLPQAFYLE